jgi:hypothetical protein
MRARTRSKPPDAALRHGWSPSDLNGAVPIGEGTLARWPRPAAVRRGGGGFWRSASEHSSAR